MAQIIRLIWRFDYEVSYSYLDKRGTALRALVNTVPDFWDNVGEGSVQMTFAAHATRDGCFRTISVEPNCLNGAMEWAAGTALERVLRDDVFRSTDKVAKEILNISEIKAVTRGGIRLFCISSYADGKRGRERGINEIGEPARKNATAAFGPIEDVSVIIEGQTPDKVNYRAQHGPYDNKNVVQVLQKKPDEETLKKLGDAADLFFDIDLFETSFSFAEHSLFRWAETKVAKAIEFVSISSGDRNRKQGEK